MSSQRGLNLCAVAWTAVLFGCGGGGQTSPTVPDSGSGGSASVMDASDVPPSGSVEPAPDLGGPVQDLPSSPDSGVGAPETTDAPASVDASAPDGVTFPLRYEQTFASPSSLDDMVFANPGGWRHDTTDGVGSLNLFRAGGYNPPFRSPTSIALVALRKFGSFVMELEVMQTGMDYGHRDLCLFFGFQDPSHYYYAHVATAQDGVSHEVHIVNNAPRTAITAGGTKGYDWGRTVWRRLRLVRDIDTGLIEVYGEGVATPLLTANSKTFGLGYVGFGSFDDTGRIRNVRVWAKDAVDGRPTFFTAGNGGR